jgi:uncharacterized protein (DUF58 family)
VFLVSDFLSVGWERAMQITRQRHEVVPIVVGDPLEQALPSVGLLVLEDLESGELVEIDTSSAAGDEYARRAKRAAAGRELALRRLNVDCVEVRTDRPYVDALIAFFKARAKRMAHG